MRHIRAATFLLAASLAVAGTTSLPASASEIRYVVNNVPVTSYDLQRRAALMRLFRQKNDAQSVSNEMIEHTLKSAEMQRLRIAVPQKAVDDSYARFASSNKLKPAQLDQILSQAGVGRDHMKEFIRVQMGWSQAISARFRATGMMTEQQMVQKVFELGGQKPSATEYMLQKVVFVVPARERGALLPKRKREAEAMRQRFNGCETTRQFVKGLIDVVVQDIPRVLEPELPLDWAEQIKKTKPGAATATRATDAGVEFIGICSAREVSDDRAAQMMLQSDGSLDKRAEEMSKKYLAELREKARIQKR